MRYFQNSVIDIQEWFLMPRLHDWHNTGGVIMHRALTTRSGDIMSNHYVFLRPGEKVFILTEEIAGETDYTQVIEVEIPLHPLRDPDGRQYHNPQKGHIVDVRQHQVLEMNDCANLTSGDYPRSTVLEAYARVNEKRLGNNPDHAFAAKPLGKWKGTPIETKESAE